MMMFENLRYNLFERKPGEPKREISWFETIFVALFACWLVDKIREE